MDYQHKGFLKTLQQGIKAAGREITILFTDIESSAKYWDKSGDLMGRLMIDYHNRLIFPIIKRFKGKVVKTIGDSIMATFKKPTKAIQAAIGIQQILQEERKKNKQIPRIRIGLHTGQAIVEKKDVFGDTVNVASRIETRAKGNEILISAQTVKKVPKKHYFLEKKDRFRPKGKKTPLTVYKCDWRKAPNVIDKMKPGSLLRLKPLQKWEIFGAAIATTVLLVLLFFKYFRYLLSDSETLALILLNPKQMILGSPFMLGVIGCICALGLFIFIKIKRIPLILFRIIHGGMGFCIGFLLFYIPMTLLPLHIGLKSEDILFHSKHLFVEIVVPEATVHKEPTLNSSVVQTVPRGILLLLSDVKQQGQLIWNKVLIGKNKYGWVIREFPPKLGEPERRISIANKFYFKIQDIYNLFFGCIGFFWAFLRFKIRPF